MPTREIIGLIPCGGYANRIAPLPCSKEILPVGLQKNENGLFRPKVVSHYLLDLYRQGGVRKAFFILRRGKWDIPDYYGDGSSVGMNLGYLVAALPYGPPYTLDQAYPFVRGKRVALGFPDILLGPADAFRQALQRLSTTRADLVLGLYRIHQARFSDMVAVDRSGRVREIILKPCEKNLKLGWMFAVWTPAFTEFLHDYLAVPRTSGQLPGAQLPEELTVGHVIQAGVREGLRTQSVFFRRQRYLDIGSPEGLQQIADGQWLGAAKESSAE
jgi:glucose-1-phosphate thymidylyltransferase